MTGYSSLMDANYPRKVYVGFDPREIAAYAVTVQSLVTRSSVPLSITAVELTSLQRKGLYTRPTKVVGGRLLDVISEHGMSTEFAISRFLVPLLSATGWALFVDCDMLARCDIEEVFRIAEDNPQCAVMCVKHKHIPISNVKMDGQVQSYYNRKNWSSVCLWNCDHPANKALTLDVINTKPGRDLHGYYWLTDDLIGELPQECNYLVGYTQLPLGVEPKIVHFTDGIPHMSGYFNCEYADEWRQMLTKSIPNVLTAFGTLPA